MLPAAPILPYLGAAIAAYGIINIGAGLITRIVSAIFIYNPETKAKWNNRGNNLIKHGIKATSFGAALAIPVVPFVMSALLIVEGGFNLVTGRDPHIGNGNKLGVFLEHLTG